MSEGRKTLSEQLKDTVEFFSNRKTVGKMKTEHSIFIPSKLMLDQSEETEEFIKTARYINKEEKWNCPVLAEKVSLANTSGVEFVFQFSEVTDFKSIIDYIDTKM